MGRSFPPTVCCRKGTVTHGGCQQGRGDQPGGGGGCRGYEKWNRNAGALAQASGMGSGAMESVGVARGYGAASGNMMANDAVNARGYGQFGAAVAKSMFRDGGEVRPALHMAAGGVTWSAWKTTIRSRAAAVKRVAAVALGAMVQGAAPIVALEGAKVGDRSVRPGGCGAFRGEVDRAITGAWQCAGGRWNLRFAGECRDDRQGDGPLADAGEAVSGGLATGELGSCRYCHACKRGGGRDGGAGRTGKWNCRSRGCRRGGSHQDQRGNRRTGEFAKSAAPVVSWRLDLRIQVRAEKCGNQSTDGIVRNQRQDGHPAPCAAAAPYQRRRSPDADL